MSSSASAYNPPPSAHFAEEKHPILTPAGNPPRSFLPRPIKAITRATYAHSRGFLGEFKAFVNRGSVVDLAVGVVVGAAFTTIVTSVVGDLLGPILGLAVGSQLSEAVVVIGHHANSSQPLQWSYTSRSAAILDGAVTINYGNFLQSIINFIVVAAIVFLFVKLVSGLRPRKAKEMATTTDCAFCDKEVSLKAKRCPYCTCWLVKDESQVCEGEIGEQVPAGVA